MPLHIMFTDEFNRTRAANAADFLRQPRLYIDTAGDYGDAAHSTWVERTEADLITGEKFGVAAIDNHAIAGVVIAKRGAEDAVDIRNISISPDVRKRDFGRFATLQLLHVVRSELPEVHKVSVDTKPSNISMVAFLKELGFRVVGMEDLYNSGKPDLLLERALQERA